MDYEIIEQFNRFWRNYRVDETLFPRRRAATLKLWIDKHPAAREAMLAEVEANGGPKGKTPYFYVQEFAEPEPTNYNGRRLKPGVTYVIARSAECADKADTEVAEGKSETECVGDSE